MWLFCYLFIFIFSHFRWLNILVRNEPCLCVCLCVCLSVCHSLLFGHYSSDFDETWTTWSYQKFEMTLFSDFENVASMTSWRPFCMFMNAALSRSQFCFDFLQNYGQGSLVSSNVCYWKSAKSVNNFRSKKRTAFTKNRFLVFKPVSEVRGSIPGGDKSFATWFLLLLR